MWTIINNRARYFRFIMFNSASAFVFINLTLLSIVVHAELFDAKNFYLEGWHDKLISSLFILLILNVRNTNKAYICVNTMADKSDRKFNFLKLTLNDKIESDINQSFNRLLFI